jgi:hypothetical protein
MFKAGSCQMLDPGAVYNNLKLANREHLITVNGYGRYLLYLGTL